MSTRTDDDSGIDLLLFVALQVSIEWTSSRLKFCMTISLRVTPLFGVVVRLVTNLSLRYQDTIGAGLPAETHFASARFSSAGKNYPDISEMLRMKISTELMRVEMLNEEFMVSLVR